MLDPFLKCSRRLGIRSLMALVLVCRSPGFIEWREVTVSGPAELGRFQTHTCAPETSHTAIFADAYRLHTRIKGEFHMSITALTDHRVTRRSLIAMAIASAAASSQLSRVLAAGGGYSEGYQVDEGGEYTFAASPAYASYNDSLYAFATGKDGSGYYATYDGKEWGAWQGYAAQPVKYQYQPTAVAYNDKLYAVYTGTDNHLYTASYDGSSWNDWTDFSGDYTYNAPAYTTTYGDNLYVYASTSDNAPYYQSFDGTTWSGWLPYDAAPALYGQPYAVDWGDHENVFYASPEGEVYWTRYDGTNWAPYKALAGDGSYSAVYAVGYAPEKKLYAYGTGTDGSAAYNVFDGSGWGGWTKYDGAPEVNYAPTAYVYDDVQYVVYTGKDNHGYQTTYDGSSWSDWEDLGGNYAYEPKQYSYDDSYNLSYTGADGYVYYRTYDGSGEASGGYDTPKPTPTPGY